MEQIFPYQIGDFYCDASLQLRQIQKLMLECPQILLNMTVDGVDNAWLLRLCSVRRHHGRPQLIVKRQHWRTSEEFDNNRQNGLN